MSTSPIVPYQGIPATKETFAQAFPEVEVARTNKGVTYLDPISRRNLDDLRRQMAATPPQHATVVNLLPWELSFPVGMPLLRGLVVPACHPGMPFSYYHIRSWRADRELMSNDEGSWAFRPITPIMQAGQFIREFLNKDNMGCGVIIYEGGQHPDKMKEVETYDNLGNPVTLERSGVMYDEEQRSIPQTISVPVKGSVPDMLRSHRETRNKAFFKRVQDADAWYRNEKTRHQVTDLHRVMADVLVAEGLIPVAPDWNLSSRLQQGLSEHNCPACQQPVAAKAYKCDCGNVIDPLAAYMDSWITIEHAKMERLTEDQWELVHKEQARRDKIKAKREKASGAKV